MLAGLSARARLGVAVRKGIYRMACPKCGGNEWKLASLRHAEGKRIVSTSSVGAGTTVGASSGPVLAMGHTSGTEQSLLSKLLEPPKPPVKGMHPAVGCGCLLIAAPVVLFFLLAVAKAPSEFFGICLVAGFFGFLLSIPCFLYAACTPGVEKNLREKHEHAMQEHQKALDEYNRKKVCSRCGEVYLGNDELDSLPQASSAMNEPLRLGSDVTKKCPFCAETILSEAVLCKHCRSKL